MIVSRTREADSLAAAFSTERFAESPGADLAQALTQATEHLVANFNAKGVFVVPADVPGIDPAQVDELIRANTNITLLPDAEHKGTNGFICAPPLAMPYVFDGQSFKPHADAAYAAGISPRIVPASAFALDVDLPEDLSTVYRQQPNSQTASYLNRSGIARRLYPTHQSHSG